MIFRVRKNTPQEENIIILLKKHLLALPEKKYCSVQFSSLFRANYVKCYRRNSHNYITRWFTDINLCGWGCLVLYQEQSFISHLHAFMMALAAITAECKRQQAGSWSIDQRQRHTYTLTCDPDLILKTEDRKEKKTKKDKEKKTLGNSSGT